MSRLSDAELPPLYQAADRSAAVAQKWFLNAIRLRLLGLIGAATFGLFTWRHNASPTDWAGVLAAYCFITALVVEGYLLKFKPERTWYEGRAAGESVKTLSWRYSVGGEPFSIGTRLENETEDLFLKQLDGVLGVLKDLDLVAPTSSGQQISKTMREVRGLPLADRKMIYEQDRVEDQQTWYARKAAWNKTRAGRWTGAMLVVEGAGIVAGILKAVGTIEGDLLVFAGVVAATMAAWLQTKQHRTLATAYSVTALELASVRSKISHQTNEGDWAKFVDDAEEAFSREHTLWKASRGVHSI
jgi:protein-S-isoprenylcysteine O-methyltransferase Ste14